MHVNRPFSGRSVVHMPSYLPVLLCVARPLHSKRGGKGTVTWGTFPRGCERTVAWRCFLYKGGGRVGSFPVLLLLLEHLTAGY